MSFNEIVDFQQSFDRNSIEIHKTYAERITLLEWLEIYIYNKDAADKLNELVNKKFKIDSSSLDLFTKPSFKKIDIKVLKQLTIKVPSIRYLHIRPTIFQANQTDILTTIQQFKCLNSLAVSLKHNLDHNITLNFQKVVYLSVNFVYDRPYSSCESNTINLSLNCFLHNMPNLQFCQFENIHLSEFVIRKLIQSKIVTFECINISFDDSIKYLFQLNSITLIKLHKHIENECVVYDKLIECFLTSIISTNDNIRQLYFYLSSLNANVSYENILNLSKLELINFDATIDNWNYYHSLIKFFSIVPMINSTCKIKFFLRLSDENFDQRILYGLTTIQKHIDNYASFLHETCPNFTFGIQTEEFI